MKARSAAASLMLLAALACVTGTPRVWARGATARATLEAAAEALGGMDRVQRIKNITLLGYGEYAYQFGGGNVVESPRGAQRMIAANELRRVYDLENDRFKLYERRNMLFTFADERMTTWKPTTQILDGDIAYSIAPGGTVARMRRWIQASWFLDGVHMLRMWKLNNPVAAVRAALDPGTQISNDHTDGAEQVMDLKLKEGDKLTLAFDRRTHLPAWVRWVNPHNNFGQLTFTTYFEGYTPNDGIMLPLSYDTRVDWRNVDYFRMYVDSYDIDGKIVDLAAPAAVRNAPEPTEPMPPIKITPIAPHIWYLTHNHDGTTVFEFADHLALFEINTFSMAQATIDAAKTLVPGKLPTQLFFSHAHPDHVEGIRVAVANGMTVYGRPGNEGILREMVEHPAPDFPDLQARHPKPLKYVPFDEHLRLSDSMMTVDLYWSRTNLHMADGTFAYVPAAKVMAEADMATASPDYQFWPDNYMDAIEYYKLDVQTLLPVHQPPMTQAQAIEFIKDGLARARQRCTDAQARQDWSYIGCPIRSKRY
jgi:glyoxylase-like metal-dependent hydrolase (beta-lactamase superfamily II)